MVDRPVSQLTLHNLFKDSERLTHELIEHLDRGFIPKVHDLRRLTRIHKSEPEAQPVEYVTVRSHSAQVLESEKFTHQLYEKLSKYLTAIDESVSRLVTEG